jgi:hypothetical protein
LPTYTIKLQGPTPNLVVQINDRKVSANVPVAVPIDPGTISVSASGHDGDRVTETWTHDYTAALGETLTIEIPALALRPAAKPAAPNPEVNAINTDRLDRRHRRHVIALVLGGVALGAAGGGTWFGLDARSRFADAKKVCGGTIDQCPTDQLASSQKHVDDARTSAMRSNILFGAAGAVMVTAAIVWITAPSLEAKRVAVAPAAGAGTVGFVLGGAF